MSTKLPLLRVVCLFFLCSATLLSAQNARVGARLKTADSGVLDLASVALLRAADSVFVKSAVPDAGGLVEFEQVPPGQYLIRVYLVGYRTHFAGPFTVESGKTELNLPDISLTENSQELAELTVTAKRPFIERKLDRLIVNVDNSIVNAGSTALEVLERSPGVSVNQDSGLRLRGKTGIIVLIDGRPTPLAGADLISYLRTIPGANIDRIELITSPSAKYDAAGNAGVIDIRLKKDKNEGLNGSVSAAYGQGFYAKPSASVNLNYREKKWNTFGNYSFGAPKGFTRFYINRKFFDEQHEVQSVFDQTSFIKQPFRSHFGKVGVDFFPDKRTVVGLLLNGNFTESNRDGYTNSIVSDPAGAVIYSTVNRAALDSRNFNGFANANFKHDFSGKGTELSVDLDYGYYDADNFQDFDSEFFDDDGQSSYAYLLETVQKGNIYVQSAKADFSCPAGSAAKLEAGLKSSLVKTDNDLAFYNVVNQVNQLDSSLSNHFIYKETVNAAYLNYIREMKKFDVQLGLRWEQTITDGRQAGAAKSFNRKYGRLFPNIAVTRKFSPKYQMGLAYNRRIDRPSYRQLNPFRIFVDSYTYVVGDPELRPTITDNFEWSHTIGGRYVVQLSYAHSKDVITDVFAQDDSTKISNQIPANIQDLDYVALSVSAPFSAAKWLNSNLSGEAYWGKYTGPLQGGRLVNADFTWNAQVINNISLGKNGWSAELNANYRAREPWGLFVIRSYWQMSAGLQKVSSDKNTTLKLSFSDIFYTNRIAVVVQYQNMDFFTNRTWDGRVVNFSITHRFGKKTVAQSRRRSSGVEDEKRRAN